MNNDIDYNELFGIDEEDAGEKEREPAEPLSEDEEDTDGTEGEKGREAADPGENIEDDGAAEATQEGGEQSGTEDQTNASGVQSAETNAAYAAARRKAEAERDAAIEEARQKAKEESEREINGIIERLGLSNPYTGEPIKTKEQYDVYLEKYDAEKRDRFIKKAGMTDEEFNDYIKSLPEVKEAMQAKAEADEQKQMLRVQQARMQMDEEIKEITKIDPSIKDVSDLSKMPTYERFYDLVKKGNTLVDAYKIANYDTLVSGRAAASRQAAINSASGKAHLSSTSARGTGAVSVPADVREMYKAFNPGVSEAEMQAHYQRSHKFD